VAKEGYVYILASKKKGTLYIGVTSNLPKRVFEHKQGRIKGFSKKYNIHKLVYFEYFDDIYNAIVREKQLKRWLRDWKIRLIEETNPEWQDLYDRLI